MMNNHINFLKALILGCLFLTGTVFDMRLRVTFLRRKTVSLQSNIAHRE
jgi:hypothetical protein